jgi:hypothetical protein
MEIKRQSKSPLFLVLSLIFSALIITLTPLARFAKPYLPYVGYLLGQEKPTTYLIMLGNDAEMRANGGFAGSYAKLAISTPPARTVLAGQPKLDLSFQDIYVPNGQLKGYVAPPAPVQEAFMHGTWMLANADWEPDFPTAATTLRWFFEKGNEIIPDNLIIINLSTIKKILDVAGSFHVPEFEADITPDNLYLFLQGKVEVGFFPGSTQKKDTLTAVGTALKNKILSLPLNKKFQIAQILFQDLKNQNIVVNSTNESFQNFLIKQNFAGKLTPSTSDTYLLVETNLGANKANAYVTRHTTHTIKTTANQVTHQVTIKFQNSSPEANPNPPFHYGGVYNAYLRFYLPENAQDIKLDREVPNQKDKTSTKYQLSTAPKYGFTELGFWQSTPAQGQTSVSLSYTLPINTQNYSLTILKQNGLVSSPQTITLNDKTYSTSLTSDFTLP